MQIIERKPPPLSVEQTKRLEELEATIAPRIETWFEVGFALTEIRTSKLYRASYNTFQEYCVGRWNMGIRQAQYLIKTSKAVAELPESTRTMVRNERQARAVAAVPAHQRVEVLEVAAATAPKDEDGTPKVTAKAIEEAAAKVAPPPPPVSKQPGEDALTIETRRLFTSLIDAAREIQDGVEKLSKTTYGRELSLQRIQTDLENAVVAIRFAMPHKLCKCGGEDKKCRVCKGMGWVTKEQADRQRKS